MAQNLMKVLKRMFLEDFIKSATVKLVKEMRK